jgi:hypothetical protein
MQLTGEALLSGSKAAKITGPEMSSDQVKRALKASVLEAEAGPTPAEIEWQLDMRKRISAEEYQAKQSEVRQKLSESEDHDKKMHSHAKVLSLTGETVLSGHKAEKILGDEMTPEEKKMALKGSLHGK